MSVFVLRDNNNEQLAVKMTCVSEDTCISCWKLNTSCRLLNTCIDCLILDSAISQVNGRCNRSQWNYEMTEFVKKLCFRMSRFMIPGPEIQIS